MSLEQFEEVQLWFRLQKFAALVFRSIYVWHQNWKSARIQCYSETLIIISCKNILTKSDNMTRKPFKVRFLKLVKDRLKHGHFISTGDLEQHCK